MGARCRSSGKTRLGAWFRGNAEPPKARLSPASHTLHENSFVFLTAVTGGDRAQRKGWEEAHCKSHRAPLFRLTSR